MKFLLLFLHEYWVGVILLMSIVLFSLWIIGYFGNGLFDCHFDLSSCWTGIGAIFTAAATGWGKCAVDNIFSQHKMEPSSTAREEIQKEEKHSCF